jgi:hypothetical protein
MKKLILALGISCSNKAAHLPPPGNVSRFYLVSNVDEYAEERQFLGRYRL